MSRHKNRVGDAQGWVDWQRLQEREQKSKGQMGRPRTRPSKRPPSCRYCGRLRVAGERWNEVCYDEVCRGIRAAEQREATQEYQRAYYRRRRGLPEE